MQAPGTALLVEDDPQVAARLRRHLTQAGSSSTTRGASEKPFAAPRRSRPMS